MSSRSDIGIAIKRSLLAKIAESKPNILQWLEAESDEQLIHDQGTCYIFRNYSWPPCGNTKIDNLYVALDDHDHDFLIVEVYHNYSFDESEFDAGEWISNPWKLHKEIVVSLYYE